MHPRDFLFVQLVGRDLLKTCGAEVSILPRPCFAFFFIHIFDGALRGVFLVGLQGLFADCVGYSLSTIVLPPLGSWLGESLYVIIVQHCAV